MPYYGDYFGLAAATVDEDAIAAAVWAYSGTRQINSVSGTVSAQLADGVVHGGTTAELALKKVEIVNPDMYGTALLLNASQTGGKGLNVQADDEQNTGLYARWPLAQMQDVADALKLAPTAGAPATGSVYADLDAIKLITDAIDTSAVTVTSTNNAGVLTFTRGVTFAATVSGLTISATWAKLYFTLKESDYDTDEMSLLQLVVTNPAAALTDGLLYLDGAAIASPVTKADGTLTVSQVGGTVGIAITDNATVWLGKASNLVWDIKTKDTAGATVQNAVGTASITQSVTQTI